MPQHFEKRTLPYTPAQMFDLVAAIDRYPEFLPWCLRAEIVDRQDQSVTADLLVGFRAIKDSFRSHVTFVQPESITVAYGGGPLKHLSNQWTFVPTADGKGCNLTFFVDFRFRSPLLGAMMDLFFEKAFFRMVEAFEARAKALYG